MTIASYLRSFRFPIPIEWGTITIVTNFRLNGGWKDIGITDYVLVAAVVMGMGNEHIHHGTIVLFMSNNGFIVRLTLSPSMNIAVVLLSHS